MIQEKIQSSTSNTNGQATHTPVHTLTMRVRNEKQGGDIYCECLEGLLHLHCGASDRILSLLCSSALGGPAAILVISRDTCSNPIAKLFRACFCGSKLSSADMSILFNESTERVYRTFWVKCQLSPLRRGIEPDGGSQR